MTNDIDKIDELIPSLSSELKLQFNSFFDLICHYNSKINLISPNTISRAGVKHFADSFLGLEIILNKANTTTDFYDFGSGNGFPGIILAMIRPNQNIILVERDLRKAEFLKIAAHNLGLKNIKVSETSVGDLLEGSCPTVISRAMAPIPKFLLESRKVVPVGGVVFLFKGSSWTREFSACPPQIFDHWDVGLCGSYALPIDLDSRAIVECKRIE